MFREKEYEDTDSEATGKFRTPRLNTSEQVRQSVNDLPSNNVVFAQDR